MGIASLLLVSNSAEASAIGTRAHDWSLSLQAFMSSNWAAFAVGQTLVAASGILPASLIAVMAGATLGFGWGFMLSTFSTMLGGWLAFMLGRTAMGSWLRDRLRRHPAIARLDDAMTCEGWRVVALLRISPIMPFALTSCGLGLTRISHRHFLLGTLASLPALAGYVAFGALGQQGLLLATGGSGGWRLATLAIGTVLAFYATLRVRRAVVHLGADPSWSQATSE